MTSSEGGGPAPLPGHGQHDATAQSDETGRTNPSPHADVPVGADVRPGPRAVVRPDGPAHLDLVVGDDSYVPLYQQVVHQIRHLITGRGLSARDRLPSVRDLAQQLGLNTGTVALAYRTLHAEGLIESRRGLGTFVATLDSGSQHASKRHSALHSAVDKLLERANALGFDATTVHRSLVARASRHRRVRFVVAMPNLRGAEKYASEIAALMPSGVTADPYCLTVAALEGDGRARLDANESAYFTFTLMSYVPRVEARLAELGFESEVIGVTAQLTASTIADLRALDPGDKYCFVAEGYNVGAGLHVLSQYSRLDLNRIVLLTDQDPADSVLAAAPDRYINTFGAAPRLDELGIPAHKRLELDFSLSPEARLRTFRLFAAIALGEDPALQEGMLVDG